MTLLQKMKSFSRPSSRQSQAQSRSSAEHTARPSSSLEGIVESEDSHYVDASNHTPSHDSHDPAYDVFKRVQRHQPSYETNRTQVHVEHESRSSLDQRSNRHNVAISTPRSQSESQSPTRPNFPTSSPLPDARQHDPQSQPQPQGQHPYHTQTQSAYTTPTSTKHRKTPSILRSLAHHPSFSALKSRSRKKKSKQLSISAGAGAGAGAPHGAAVGGDHIDQSPAGLATTIGKKLRASWSVPEGLRTSEERSRESETDAFSPPPLPSPTLRRSFIANPLPHPNLSNHSSDIIHQQQHQQQQRRHLEISHSRPPTLSRRGSATPSIRIQHHDMGTPESIKVTKMRLELEIESPQMDRMDRTPNSVRSYRSRSRSVNEGSGGTPTPSAWPSPSFGRNRYNPTNVFNPSPPRLSAPPMMQTPHHHHRPSGHGPPSFELSPHLRPQRDEYLESEPEESEFDEDEEFQAVEDQMQMEEDPLEVFVAQEELPVGTPGGKKADLRRGALVDGAKHERGAIRFFSRDTYSAMSNYSSDSVGPLPTAMTMTNKQAKRSSSPFEIKLTPNVSKRISLDAFGTPTPPVDAEEELMDGEYEDEHSHQQGVQQVDVDVEVDVKVEASFDSAGQPFYSGLSTIKESPSTAGNRTDQSIEGRQVDADLSGQQGSNETLESEEDGTDREDQGNSLPRTPVSDNETLDIMQTYYYTPVSSPHEPQKGARTGTDTQTPSISRSPFVPPRHFSAPPLQLQGAQGITTALLKAQEKHSDALKDQLSASEGMIAQLQAEVRSLKDTVEEAIEERRKVWVDLRDSRGQVDDLEQEIMGYKATVTQLHTVVSENESHFDNLHYEYEELLQHKATLESTVHDRTKAEAELRAKLEEVERQLDATADDYTIHLRTHQEELAVGQRQNLEHQSTIARQALEVERLLGQAADVQGSEELKATISRLEVELTEVKASANGLHVEYEKHKRKTRESLEELELALKKAREQVTVSKDAEMNATRKLAELELRLSEAVATSAQQEQINLDQAERIDRLRSETKAANLALIEKEATIEVLKDKLREARFEMNERRFEADAEIDRLRNGLEERDSQIEEIEGEMRKVEDEKASRIEYYSTTLLARDEEIARVYTDLKAMEEAQAESDSRQREMSRELERAIAAETEWKEKLAQQEFEIEAAFFKAEGESTRAESLESKLTAYLGEIDRLKLSETGLKDQLASLRQLSASDEMIRFDLAKQVKQLEEDKEMLNVALESKQMELTLVSRRIGTGGPRPAPGHSTPASRSLAASTSRIPYTPSASTSTSTPSSNANNGKSQETTPLASDSHRTLNGNRQLSSSVSGSTPTGHGHGQGHGHAAAKSARRESSLIGQTPSTARSNRQALSSASHHNRMVGTPNTFPEKGTTKIVFSTSASSSSGTTGTGTGTGGGGSGRSTPIKSKVTTKTAGMESDHFATPNAGGIGNGHGNGNGNGNGNVKKTLGDAKKIERRSSLPVLVRKPSVIGQARQTDGSLIEEDEDAFA